MRRRRVRSKRAIVRRRTRSKFRRRIRRHGVAIRSASSRSYTATLTFDFAIDPATLSPLYFYQGSYQLNQFYATSGTPSFHTFWQNYRIHWIRETLRPRYNTVQNMSLQPSNDSPNTTQQSNPTISAPMKRSLAGAPTNQDQIRMISHSKVKNAWQTHSRKWKPAVEFPAATSETHGQTYNSVRWSPLIEANVSGMDVIHFCSLWYIGSNTNTADIALSNIYDMYVTAKVTFYNFNPVAI